MKKTAFTLLTILLAHFIYSQSNYIEILKNVEYEEITNPDIVFNQQNPLSLDSVNGTYINLNFRIPGFETARLYVSATRLRIINKTNKLIIEPYPYWFTEDMLMGIYTTDSLTTFSVKYNENNNEPTSTVLEIRNLFYSNFPEHRYGYKVKLFKDGRIEVNYGPNTVKPNFIAYTDHASFYQLYKNNEVLNYAILGGNPLNPTIYDLDNPYDEDTFKPFDYFQNPGLGFAINAPFVLDGTTSISLLEKENQIEVRKNQLIIKNLSTEEASLLITSLDGSQITKTTINHGVFYIDVSEFKNQLIIVKIYNNVSSSSRKLFLN